MSKIIKYEQKSSTNNKKENTINLYLDDSIQGLKRLKNLWLNCLNKTNKILNKDISHLIKEENKNKISPEEKDNNSNNEMSILPLINISNILKDISSSFFSSQEKETNKNNSTIFGSYKAKKEYFTDFKNQINKNNDNTLINNNNNFKKENFNLKYIRNINKPNNKSSATFNIKKKILNNFKNRSLIQRKINIKNQSVKKIKPLLYIIKPKPPELNISLPRNNSFNINNFRYNNPQKNEVLNKNNSTKNLHKLDEYYFNLKLKVKEKDEIRLKAEKEIINKIKLNNSSINNKEDFIKLERIHSLRKINVDNSSIKDIKNNSSINLGNREIFKNKNTSGKILNNKEIIFKKKNIKPLKTRKMNFLPKETIKKLCVNELLFNNISFLKKGKL